ncbi:MAG: hypothetical protein JW795_21355 [Chitinivibrionales bacterium]|nr:hypothetical protein [Chitinivibrionales bacterium]
MKVLVITEEESFYLYEFFKEFYRRGGDAPYTISAVTICAPFNTTSTITLARQMFGFYGPVNFFRMASRFIVRKAIGKTVAGITSALKIPLWVTENINNPAYIDCIRNHHIDCIVSIAAPQIFKKALIESVRFGCINSHSSLLPKHRGMMPVFWGMYEGDPQIGVTVHYMNDQLDKGDIIRQERVIVGTETLHEMILKTKILSVKLIHETLCSIAAGTCTAHPMPSGGSFHTFPTPAQVRAFRRKGKKII